MASQMYMLSGDKIDIPKKFQLALPGSCTDDVCNDEPARGSMRLNKPACIGSPLGCMSCASAELPRDTL